MLHSVKRYLPTFQGNLTFPSSRVKQSSWIVSYSKLSSSRHYNNLYIAQQCLVIQDLLYGITMPLLARIKYDRWWMWVDAGIERGHNYPNVPAVFIACIVFEPDTQRPSPIQLLAIIPDTIFTWRLSAETGYVRRIIDRSLKKAEGLSCGRQCANTQEFCVPLLACCLCDALQWLAILFHTSQSLSPKISVRLYCSSSGVPLTKHHKQNAILQRICTTNWLTIHLQNCKPSQIHRISHEWYFAAFEVLTAMLLKIGVFWDVTLCRLIVTDVSEALRPFRTSPRRNSPKDLNL